MRAVQPTEKHEIHLFYKRFQLFWESLKFFVDIPRCRPRKARNIFVSIRIKKIVSFDQRRRNKNVERSKPIYKYVISLVVDSATERNILLIMGTIDYMKVIRKILNFILWQNRRLTIVKSMEY